MTAVLKQAEEAKRDRCWNPRRRWKALMETLNWAEAQAASPRNTPANRIREQNRKLQGSPSRERRIYTSSNRKIVVCAAPQVASGTRRMPSNSPSSTTRTQRW